MRIISSLGFRWGVAALIVSGVFWIGGDVFAQPLPSAGIFTDSGGINIERIKTADALLKTLYLIMWPLLALAGAALDNTLVYGKAFYLAEVLYKFRQLIRTFTMFGIGFIFVGTILYAYFNPATAQEKIKDVVIKSLLATVAINMSRWIVAALIDISTILVVAIGALPLQIMGDTMTIKDIRFVQTHSYYDKVDTTQTNANEKTYSTVYSCPADGSPVFFIPCEFKPVQVGGNTTLGLIPQQGPSDTDTLENSIQTALQDRGSQSGKIGMNDGNISRQYCVQDGSLIAYKPGTQINKCEEREKQKELGRIAMKATEDGGQFNCSSFSKLTTLAANTSGPLYTLYGSIFALSNLPATTNYGNIGEVAIEMLMKIIVGLGLVVPLLTFAVVMIIRVVVLWLVIAFSPILAMAYVYDFEKITKVSGDKFTWQSILNLLMMPVLGVFALSISIVFLSVLNNVDFVQSQVNAEKTQEGGKCYDDTATAMFQGVERINTPEGITDDNTVCYRFLGLQTVCLNEGERVSIGKVANTFTRLITNMLGIALMRMAVMAVLKTNDFTKGTVDFIDSTAKSIAKSTKIIPVPGIGPVSVGGAQQAMSSLGRIPTMMAQKAYENDPLQAFTKKVSADLSGVDERVTEEAEKKAVEGDTSFIKSPGSNAEAFGFDKRESKGLPTQMGTAVANDITNNPTTYPQFKDADLEPLRKATSFEDLFKSPVFVQYAQGKGDFDDLTKNRGGMSPSQKLRASRDFIGGINKQPGVVSKLNTAMPLDKNGFRDERYLHNGLATKVRRNPDTGMIDYSDTGGVKTYDFPSFTAGSVPDVFASREELSRVLNVVSKEFNNDIGAFQATFAHDGQLPYKTALAGFDPNAIVADSGSGTAEVVIGTETYRINVKVTGTEGAMKFTSIGAVPETPVSAGGGSSPIPPTTPPGPVTS